MSKISVSEFVTLNDVTEGAGRVVLLHYQLAGNGGKK